MQYPIGEHALLADSRTAALIDPAGTVAWLCWPWINSTPLLFSILDEERGGGLTLRPARQSARVASRRYHARSLVLETIWESDGARMVVEDALDLGENQSLMRSLRAEGGDVEVDVDFRAPRWETLTATMHIAETTLEVTGPANVVITTPSPWTARTSGAGSRFVVRPGEPALVTLGSAGHRGSATGVETTLASWRKLVPAGEAFDIDLTGSRAGEAVVRDLLGTTAAVMLGLRNRRGGIVAAPTTSLPEQPGALHGEVKRLPARW